MANKVRLDQLLVQRNLVESREKKCFFLETAARELGLADTRVIQARLGAFVAGTGDSWDCVSWKGVKLEAREIAELARQAARETRFWMFHGQELAVDDPGKLEEVLELERRSRCPARPGWRLSVYRRKCFT